MMQEEVFMNPIEFRDISYILAVNAERSFSRAAEQIYLTQPTISNHISTL